MRILAAGEPIPLDKMGFSERNLQHLKSAVSNLTGYFSAAGPPARERPRRCIRC